MTKTALRRIASCLCAIALLVGGCIAIENVVSYSSSSDEPAIVSGEPDHAAIDTGVMMSAIEDEDTTPLALANTLFGGSIDEKLPEEFTDEAVDPTSYEDTYASGTVIELIYDGTSSEARSVFEAQLKIKGWIGLDQGDQTLTSFMKPSGAHRWLTAQYLTIEAKSAIVINIIDPNG